ncbi:MAG: FtsL-like putative cell division protein [Hominimerdicola sp.]
MAKMNNLALDYSVYDQAEASEKRVIKHKSNTSSRANKMMNVKFVLGLALVMSLLCAMIFGKVEISSLCAEQTTLNQQLEQLQSENVSLQSELAQKTSMTKVEEYAEGQLGLQKLDKSQIEYVEVENKPSATVIEADEQNVFVKIKNWFSSVLEYIGA